MQTKNNNHKRGTKPSGSTEIDSPYTNQNESPPSGSFSGAYMIKRKPDIKKLLKEVDVK